MPRSRTKKEKPQPKVTLSITVGPMTPFQKHAWDKFLAKLIADAKKEQNDNND